jgi:hypothetical protein
METGQAEVGISASGQRRRDRRKKMKRLGFEQVTLFVPKGEVKALKRTMLLKEKVAEAKKAAAELEKANGELVSSTRTLENKAGSDVLGGATPPAAAATRDGTPPVADTGPQTSHHSRQDGPYSPIGTPSSLARQSVPLGTAGKDTRPDPYAADVPPRRELTEQERRKMLDAALPSYMKNRSF